MTFIKLGFRSLFRQKRRTLITLIVITFGIGCLLLTVGHTTYIDWGLRESTIHSETGHLQVFHPEFFDKEEETILQYGLENHDSFARELYGLDEVQLVQARIDLMGLISNGDKSVACVGQGVDPEAEKKLRTLFTASGAAFDSLIAYQHEDDCIVLGRGLARSLNAKTGDWLTLLSTTADGALNALDVRVVDTFSSSSSEYDKRAIMLPLVSAQRLLNTSKVQKLIVTIDKTERTDVLFEQLASLANEKEYPIALKKWHEQAQYYHQVRQFFGQITGFISVVLFIIVFFSTSNTIVMSIVERTREIGTLLSVGTSHIQTVKMFFFEGLFVGLIGGVFSMVFAYFVSLGINAADIQLPPPPGLTDGYPLAIRNEMGFYSQVFVVTLLVTTVSSLGPAFRVTRMKIVDALGHI